MFIVGATCGKWASIGWLVAGNETSCTVLMNTNLGFFPWTVAGRGMGLVTMGNEKVVYLLHHKKIMSFIGLSQVRQYNASDAPSRKYPVLGPE